MRTITIHLPNTIDLGDKEAKMALASKLYESGKLTLGQAAELAGYSKETFMDSCRITASRFLIICQKN